ncbi:hypothetical protein GGI12_000255 [Dipsacomyces acuminosporus]|nr:hypothetical protein GGI12_000255 [Dipsacomyces acuminosporus]
MFEEIYIHMNPETLAEDDDSYDEEMEQADEHGNGALLDYLESEPFDDAEEEGYVEEYSHGVDDTDNFSSLSNTDGADGISDVDIFQTPPTSSATIQHQSPAQVQSTPRAPQEAIYVSTQAPTPASLDRPQPILINGNAQHNNSNALPIPVDSSPHRLSQPQYESQTPALPSVRSFASAWISTNNVATGNTNGSDMDNQQADVPASSKRRSSDLNDAQRPGALLDADGSGSTSNKRRKTEPETGDADTKQEIAGGAGSAAQDGDSQQARGHLQFKCAVCLDQPDPAVFVQPCGHVFCEGCAQGAVQTTKRCPVCRHALRVKDIRILQFRVAKVGRE